jgi:hypothetical protein
MRFGTGFIGEYDATTGATINAPFTSGLIRPTFLAVVEPPEAVTPTPVGSNVTVDMGAVGSAVIALTFPQVTGAGTTRPRPLLIRVL